MSDGIPLISSPLPVTGADIDPGWGRLAPALSWLSRCRQQWPLTPLNDRHLVLFTDRFIGSAIQHEPSDTSTRASTTPDADELEETQRRELLRGLCRDFAHLHCVSSQGRQLADELIDSGADLLIPALSGEEDQVTALIGSLTSTEPVALVDCHLDVAAWQEKVASLRTLMFRIRTDHTDAYTMLKKVNAPLLRELMEFMQQAALRKTPMLIDSPAALLAALLSEQLTPGVRQWIFLADVPDTPAAQAVAEQLVVTPMTNLGIASAQGAGALSVLHLLDAVIAAI